MRGTIPRYLLNPYFLSFVCIFLVKCIIPSIIDKELQTERVEIIEVNNFERTFTKTLLRQAWF